MSFKERFNNAETSFLSALRSGTAALNKFDVEWETLRADFETAMDHSTVDSTEVDFVYAVASRVAILSDSFLKLEQATADITSNWLSDISTALSDLTLQDMAGAAPSNHHSTPYIREPFLWFLDNLHDPYPSSSMKRTWARNARVTPRAMDDWFKSMRKEIGWVSLTKLHFNGSRSSAVAAASAVLCDTSFDAAVPFEVQTELFAIKARLENLFRGERGLVAESSSLKHSEPLHPLSTPSSAIDVFVPSRSNSPSMQSDASGDVSTTSYSPSSQSSSRLPSLVFDQSDSEDDERFPEFFIPTLLDHTSVRVTDLTKGDDTGGQLEHCRHFYYDLGVEDPSSSQVLDPFSQPVDTHPILDILSPTTLCQTVASKENSLASSPDSLSVSLDNLIPSPLSLTTEPLSVSPVPIKVSQKRRLEDENAEVQEPASKKSRVVHSSPRSNARKQQIVSPPTPTIVTNMQPDPIEPPAIDWEQLFKDLDAVSSQNSNNLSNLSGPVDCNVFDFGALGSATLTNKVPASTSDAPLSTADYSSWDQIVSSAAAFETNEGEPTSTSEDDAFQELLANFTHTNNLISPPSSDYSENAFSIELSPELACGLEPISGTSALSDLLVQSPPHATESGGLLTPSILGGVSQSQVLTQTKDVLSSLDCLVPFSSGDPLSFDLSCFPPPLVAFS